MKLYVYSWCTIKLSVNETKKAAVTAFFPLELGWDQRTLAGTGPAPVPALPKIPPLVGHADTPLFHNTLSGNSPFA